MHSRGIRATIGQPTATIVINDEDIIVTASLVEKARRDLKEEVRSKLKQILDDLDAHIVYQEVNIPKFDGKIGMENENS